ncbi:MAG TPA: crosslink repair DNA glycosylase YcaQ family protein [Candidatus Limnocylindrales bacterium]
MVRHFGSLQIDPTRTIEKTHYLVLWSRIGNYDRAVLDRVTYEDRRLIEHNAFYVPVERLPELRFEAGPWISTWPRVQQWLATNSKFHDSILDQLHERGPLQSRDIDDSMIVKGWESTGWTHGRNTTRMLEFMGKKLEVVVAGRVGQERLWDLPERVIPADAPQHTLDDDEYAARTLERAMKRFGVADLREIKARTYWVPKAALPKAIDRFVDEGRLIPVSLPRQTTKRSTWITPEALAVADSDGGSRTTFLSPFDPLIYDRDRTREIFDFEYKLEMYVPKEERKFGHFSLPVVFDDQLVGRLDSAVDRKSNVLIVNKLHWESAKASARMNSAVDEALAHLAEFVGAREVRR